MALIAWYPLDDNLLDYSGNNNDLRIYGSSSHFKYTPNGKIGIALERPSLNNGASHYYAKNKIHLKEDFTLCVWAKVSALHSGTANGLVSNHSHSDNTGPGITVKHVSNTDFRISCNTGHGTGRTYHSYYGTTNIKDKWSHLTMRYIKKTQELTLWVNGKVEHKRTYNMHTIPDNLGVFLWSTTNAGANNYRPAAKLNDVRVYDHALSSKEIQEIVKAKIIHFKFNDPHEEGTENLLIGGEKKTSTSRYNIEDYKFSKPMVDGRTYTISMKAKMGSGKSYFGVYNSGGSVSVVSLTPSDRDQHGVYSKTFNWRVGSSNNSYLRVYHMPSSKVVSSTIEWIQVEEGSRSTPFTKNQRNSFYYDSSGFNNHGSAALTNTPKWVPESICGRGSLKFNNSKITHPEPFFKQLPWLQEWTVTAWVKPESGTNFILNNFNFVNGIGLGSTQSAMYLNGGSNAYLLDGEGYPLNEWSLISFVFRAQDDYKKIYRNGIDISLSDLKVSETPIGFIKGITEVGESLIGLMSDYRVYATALSEEDILKIYHSKANVDKDGNVRADFFKEGSAGTKTNVDKKSVLTSSEFSEVGMDIRYIRENMGGSNKNDSSHWVEIEAYDENDTNIALGKSANHTYLTDGNTNSNPYKSGNPATVDLGKVYKIDYLKTYHYYADSRIYKNIITEVSKDGTNWITVFDSEVDGRYTETKYGKTIPLPKKGISINKNNTISAKKISEV